MGARTFTTAVSQYVRACGPDLEGHDVMVVALKQVAKKLDEEVTASLIAQYRMLHATLQAVMAGKAAPAEDEDDLLSPNR